MPLVSMRQLLDEASKGGYGVGAFNVNNMEQIQSIMEAAKETNSPVIIQASRGARAYSQDRFLYHLMLAATEIYPEIPTVLHLDHGNSVETCKSAIDMGFTSVMMDGSLLADGKTPSSFEYNVEATRKVVEMAHDKGITVEQIYKATALLKKNGIHPSFFIQFGYSGETKEDIAKTIRMIKDLLPYEMGISVSYPLPGTVFYERVKADLKEKTNWTDSDELLLMFRNTYPPAFYKQLHRYVHRSYGWHLALRQLGQMIVRPALITGSRLRTASRSCSRRRHLWRI